MLSLSDVPGDLLLQSHLLDSEHLAVLVNLDLSILQFLDTALVLLNGDLNKLLLLLSLHLVAHLLAVGLLHALKQHLVSLIVLLKATLSKLKELELDLCLSLFQRVRNGFLFLGKLLELLMTLLERVLLVHQF